MDGQTSESGHQVCKLPDLKKTLCRASIARRLSTKQTMTHRVSEPLPVHPKCLHKSPGTEWSWCQGWGQGMDPTAWAPLPKAELVLHSEGSAHLWRGLAAECLVGLCSSEDQSSLVAGGLHLTPSFHPGGDSDLSLLEPVCA